MSNKLCRMRFGDNQKIENYTISSESSSQPFTNALDTRRSKLYDADAKQTRLVVDLDFPDLINSLAIFGPLGEQLGISREAEVRLQADNVNDWTSPEYDVLIDVNSDQQIIYFEDVENYYRFWSVFIDDPTREDNINFGYIYMGDYTTTDFRNIANPFKWVHNDPTKVVKSLNGTAYFDVLTEFDKFNAIKYDLASDGDRKILDDLYLRTGKYTPILVSLDPQTEITSDINDLTRLARFSSNMSIDHQVLDRYAVTFSMEEVI